MTPYPSIPDPSEAPSLLLATSRALREAVDILLGRRGQLVDKAVTVQDLIDLGLADKYMAGKGELRPPRTVS